MQHRERRHLRLCGETVTGQRAVFWGCLVVVALGLLFVFALGVLAW